MDVTKLTIKDASRLLKKREISSLELTKAIFARIKKLNQKLNAYICVLEEEATNQATASDKRRTNNEQRSILDGIPIAIKDNMCMEDTLTTCGSKILSNFVSPYDATVIDKLKNAGAVFLGKTNMDEFAMGSSTETSHFGPTKNPWDLKRVPGGSSGGSAASVAADLCLGALGSDTGGSIRQPASLCGIVGFKPTYGTVSRYGLIAMASSLDQIGPITKTVDDAKILFDAIKGYDERDSTSVKLNSKSEIRNSKQIPNSTFRQGRSAAKAELQIKNTKIGIPKEFFIKGTDKNVEKSIKDAIKAFEKKGAKIVDVSLPHVSYALAVYYIIVPSEVSSNLARFDGIKYGYSAIGDKQLAISDLYEVYTKSRASGFGDEAKRRIMLGSFALSSGYYEAYYLKAKKVQTKIKEEFEEVFKKVDCLITPTSPTIAFKIGEKTDNPLTMYLADIFTVPVNIAGLPAISIPCGLADNLPVGLQIIGPQFSDEKILDFASFYERNSQHNLRCTI